MTDPRSVLVIGAGLAGLCAARRLQAEGFIPRVLEANPWAGGRASTQLLEGFRLDRGFQVLSTAYPEALRQLDFGALDLCPFEPGALVFQGTPRGPRFTRLSDPFRRPLEAFGALLGGPGTLADKLRVLRLRARARRGSLKELFERPEVSSAELLDRLGFSPGFITGFLRPFLGGVFLEDRLETSSRMLDFVWRMFAEGSATLPAAGVGAMAEQLVNGLPADCVRLGARVHTIQSRESGWRLELAGGEPLEARWLVVAADPVGAARLLGPALTGLGLAPLEAPRMLAVTNLYFSAPSAPIRAPLLVLNGSGKGRVLHLCVPSRVAPSYAPPGSGLELISVTVLGNPPEPDERLEAAVLAELAGWFGPATQAWRALATLRIEQALPAQPPGVLEPAERPVRLAPGLFVCGDHRDQGSIQGALVSGRRAAEALLAEAAATRVG